MNNQIAQFIDNYAGADQITSTDMEPINDASLYVEGTDESTSWEEFCSTADAWARHAQASNGFGGF